MEHPKPVGGGNIFRQDNGLVEEARMVRPRRVQEGKWAVESLKGPLPGTPPSRHGAFPGRRPRKGEDVASAGGPPGPFPEARPQGGGSFRANEGWRARRRLDRHDDQTGRSRLPLKDHHYG